jgi:hypothetical protein
MTTVEDLRIIITGISENTDQIRRDIVHPCGCILGELRSKDP